MAFYLYGYFFISHNINLINGELKQILFKEIFNKIDKYLCKIDTPNGIEVCWNSLLIFLIFSHILHQAGVFHSEQTTDFRIAFFSLEYSFQFLMRENTIMYIKTNLKFK